MCHCHTHSSSSGTGWGSDSKGCGCSCHNTGGTCHIGGCSQGSSGYMSGHQCQEGHCDYVSKFLELADQAWMEVLKEKIKEHIKSNPKNMDDLAKIISEANNDRWRIKIENKHCTAGYEDKIRSFFNGACQGQKK